LSGIEQVREAGKRKRSVVWTLTDNGKLANQIANCGKNLNEEKSCSVFAVATVHVSFLFNNTNLALI